MSKVDEIFEKLRKDGANERASCTQRKNWEGYNFKYKEFEAEAKEAINQLLIEAKIEELKAIKYKEVGYESNNDSVNCVYDRISELQQSLKDKE